MGCQIKRELCHILSRFSAIVSSVCFVCNKLRTERHPQANQPKSCLTDGPDFDCAECQAGYQCPQEGIRQLHTETPIVTMEWVDPTGQGKIIVETRDRSLYPFPWPKTEQ